MARQMRGGWLLARRVGDLQSELLGLFLHMRPQCFREALVVFDHVHDLRDEYRCCGSVSLRGSTENGHMGWKEVSLPRS